VPFTRPHYDTHGEPFVATTHYRHGYEIAKDLPLSFDAVVCLSGDGMLHEVLAGFADHSFPMRAFRIPLVPVPTGSANGTSLNLNGFEASSQFVTCPVIVVNLRTSMALM
jgi:diacylglycerol kinase family enzyme